MNTSPSIRHHHTPRPQQQKGAVLVVALVFLIILTTLAVTNMREVALEARITGNLIDQKSCFNAAEAGLRDGEFRVAGRLHPESPGSYPVIPISTVAGINRIGPPDTVSDCSDLGFEQACVFDAKPAFNQVFTAEEAAMAASGTVGSNGFGGARAFSPDGVTVMDQEVVWYALPYDAGASQGESISPEYGNLQSGVGTFFHEINARATDNTCETRLRSTVRRVYL